MVTRYHVASVVSGVTQEDGAHRRIVVPEWHVVASQKVSKSIIQIGWKLVWLVMEWEIYWIH